MRGRGADAAGRYGDLIADAGEAEGSGAVDLRGSGMAIRQIEVFWWLVSMPSSPMPSNAIPMPGTIMRTWGDASSLSPTCAAPM